jgi:hypothetical protein
METAFVDLTGRSHLEAESVSLFQRQLLPESARKQGLPQYNMNGLNKMHWQAIRPVSVHLG